MLLRFNSLNLICGHIDRYLDCLSELLSLCLLHLVWLLLVDLMADSIVAALSLDFIAVKLSQLQ